MKLCECCSKELNPFEPSWKTHCKPCYRKSMEDKEYKKETLTLMKTLVKEVKQLRKDLDIVRDYLKFRDNDSI